MALRMASRVHRRIATAGALVLGACIGGLAGCDRSPQVDNRDQSPQNARIEVPDLTARGGDLSTRPATTPAETQLGRAIYLQYPRRFDASGKPITIVKPFPAALLHLTAKDGEPVRAILCSDDDPKEVLDRNWRGDRYYFQFSPPGVFDAASMVNSEWRKTGSASAADREESDSGVFLQGDRIHLDPVNVEIVVSRDPLNTYPSGGIPAVQVDIRGEFLQYDSTNPAMPPEPVFVQARLLPRVSTK